MPPLSPYAHARPSPFAYETAGAARPRHSLRPLNSGGTCHGKDSDAFAPREGALTSHRRHSGRAPFLGASLRCAIAHRGIHPTAIIAAQWIPGSLRFASRPGMTTRRVAAKWHDGQDCASHRPQISGLRSPVPFRQEGRIAIVTNAGRDVVDARASARQGVAGRVEPRERY